MKFSLDASRLLFKQHRSIIHEVFLAPLSVCVVVSRLNQTHMFMITRLTLGISLVVLIGLLTAVFSRGHSVARENKRHLLWSHKSYGRLLLWFLLGFSVLLEVFLRFTGKRPLMDGLMIFHVVCAVLFLLGVVALNYPFSGMKSPPRTHRRLAYITLVFAISTLITALPIIMRMG